MPPQAVWVSTVLRLPGSAAVEQGQGVLGRAEDRQAATITSTQRICGGNQSLRSTRGGERGGVSSFRPCAGLPALPCILSQDETVTDLCPQDTDSHLGSSSQTRDSSEGSSPRSSSCLHFLP